MKNLKFTFFFMLLVAFLVNAPMSYAVKPVTTPVTETVAKTEKKQKFFKRIFKKKRTSLRQRFAKWKHNLVGKILKKGIDLQDPVKKWLWYALLSWGVGILLYIVSTVLIAGSLSTAATTGATTGFGIAGVLGIVGGLITLFGTVAFIIWLVKKFG